MDLLGENSYGGFNLSKWDRHVVMPKSKVMNRYGHLLYAQVSLTGPTGHMRHHPDLPGNLLILREMQRHLREASLIVQQCDQIRRPDLSRDTGIYHRFLSPFSDEYSPIGKTNRPIVSPQSGHSNVFEIVEH